MIFYVLQAMCFSHLQLEKLRLTFQQLENVKKKIEMLVNQMLISIVVGQ